jgi:hypothetical protein
MENISTKEIYCPYSGNDQHHVTSEADMPQQIQDDTPSLNCQAYSKEKCKAIPGIGL